jgi:hypothetical protein
MRRANPQAMRTSEHKRHDMSRKRERNDGPDGSGRETRGRAGVSQPPVFEAGRGVGMLSRDDIIGFRWHDVVRR